MASVFFKEILNYFKSVTAYLTSAVALMICGFLFFLRVSHYADYSKIAAAAPPGMGGSINFNTAILASLPSTVIFVTLFFVIPIMTMRLFSEEKKNGTLEMLFTYPLTEVDLIAGKYLSCFLALMPGVILSIFFPLFLHSKIPSMDMGYLAGGYIGVILACMAGVAIGMWASSLSDSQLISGIVSILVFLGLWLIGGPASGLEQEWAKSLLSGLSFADNMEPFTKGSVSLSNVVYFLGLTLLFIYLTYYNLSARKWRG